MDRIIRLFMFGALVFVIPGCKAQMVASRDLTGGWRVPPEHVPGPPIETCPKVKYSVAGNDKVSQPEGERMELSIVQISPGQLQIGEAFTATVRLKNAGAGSVLVPATADGAHLTESAGNAEQDKTEEKYEVADVSFRLATGKDRRTPIFLTSTGALFADPDDKNSYVSLAPGTWFDVRLKGVVECGAPKCLGILQPDSDAVLTAWWYQRVLTHRVNGCEESHGSIDVREVDSAPFRIAVHKAAKQSKLGPLL